MPPSLVLFDEIPHVILRERDDWGVRVFDLASPPSRLWGDHRSVPAQIRTNIDPYKINPIASPGELLTSALSPGDTWSAMTKRSLARFAAFYLISEDPQRRLDAREVVTLAHQVSLVRHILDSPGKRRVLIGDEVGLGKTVEAGLIIRELMSANPGLRVLYLAPARLVTNVGKEFKRLNMFFREWKAQESDARLEADSKIIASIHRAVHPNHFDRLLKLLPWDVIVVDECHHLSDWSEGGGDPVRKYKLVRELVAAQGPESFLLLLSGTPHQAHTARFDNLLRFLGTPGEPVVARAGRVIYRTKEDVRDWDGNPLFPKRQVNAPILVDLEQSHRDWLAAIHMFFSPTSNSGSQAAQRASGWKCAQALQWAASSSNAGLGYLVRQALRGGWTLQDVPLSEALAALRPYRSGASDEPVQSLYDRMVSEISQQECDDDVEDIEDSITGRGSDHDHEALAALLAQGIKLVRSSRQMKWERLWRDVIEPANGEKLVLFAQPIETVMALATWLSRKTGVQPSIIMGGQTDAEREEEVSRFRNPRGPQFLISSRAGGEGINLQFCRRLVHLDVPWNPMEMEQRVGRVHRFGSKQTVLVDTLVVRDSRETHAWDVARERLRTVAQTLVGPDRFETVFSRVMCLIPPEELQKVLINSPAFPLTDADVERLSSMIESGFREWQTFHDLYAANQREIRDQPAGLARWSHLKDFLLAYGGAELAPGISRTRFIELDKGVKAVDEPAEVLKLADGSLCFVGDYEGALFSGDLASRVGPLGLNVQPVSNVLRACAHPHLPTGAGHVRWGETQKSLRGRLGDDIVVLAFVRQTFHFDSIGGTKEAGTELLAYVVRDQETAGLAPQECVALLAMHEQGTIRVRPVESPLHIRAAEEEQRLVDELRRPSEHQIRQGIRYAVWPILALHVSP